MPSLRLLVLCGFLGGASCATAAGPATRGGGGDQATDYYPLLPGWGWAFEIERDGGRVLALYSVVERTPELAVVRNGDERIAYAILPTGIARREGDLLLPNPIRADGRWPLAEGEARVVEMDKTITLASGRYQPCLVVEEVRRDPSRITRTTYCRATGPVEIEVRVFDPFSRGLQTVAHARLLSLTKPDGE